MVDVPKSQTKYNHAANLYPRPIVGKSRDYRHFMYWGFLLPFLDDIFQSHWYYSRKDKQFQQRAIIRIIYKLGLSDILLMCVSISFLIVPRIINNIKAVYHYCYCQSADCNNYFLLSLLFLIRSLFSCRILFLLSFIYWKTDINRFINSYIFTGFIEF